MEKYSLIEIIAIVVCPILSVIISVMALFKSNYAVKKVNNVKVEIDNIGKKQEANNNTNSQVNQRMK